MYFEMLRENPFISSPDLTKIRLRSNFKEKMIHLSNTKAKNSDDNDEDYSRYSSDKARKIHRMSMKTIPLKQTYSQPLAAEPQSQRVQDYQSLAMSSTSRPGELSQPKLEKNFSMKQISPEVKFEEQKFEGLKINHPGSGIQTQQSLYNSRTTNEPQIRSDFLTVSFQILIIQYLFR